MQRTCHKPLFVVFSTNASYTLLRKTSAYPWAPVFMLQLRFLPTQWQSMNYFYSAKLKNNFLRKINNWSVQKLTFCTFILHFNIFSVTAGVVTASAVEIRVLWVGGCLWTQTYYRPWGLSPNATQNASFSQFGFPLTFRFLDGFLIGGK